MDDCLVNIRDVELALIEKGQASKRYKLGETWELNGEEIREALEELKQKKEERKIYEETAAKFGGEENLRELVLSEIDKMEQWRKEHPDDISIGPSYKYTPMAGTGWICPKCGRSLGPFVSICPCSDKWEVTC